jgi:ABC-2 type transport system ATP-binding protein
VEADSRRSADVEAAPRCDAAAMPVISVEHLHKRYGDVVAAEDVSFAVEEGEIFGILGPNGAGKTTTVECVAGLRAPDGGRVEVAGLDPGRDHPDLRRILGVQLQAAELPDKLTVGEALALYASFYPDPADPAELLDALGLTAKVRTRFAKLSGGQRQRLSMALALIGRPRIAILDELTTGLDPAARRETWALVREIRDRGVTILLVTHFMEEAERLCDRVAMIDRGRVVALDTPAALAAAAQGGQRLRFRPSRPLEDDVLLELPEVHGVARDGDDVVVTGGDEVLLALAGALAREGVVPERLRVDRASLEDAFMNLTGKEIA